MIRRVRADALDRDKHPDLDLERVLWVNRPGNHAYRARIHHVERDHRGDLIVTLGEGERLPVRYRCSDHDSILLDMPLREGEVEIDRQGREIER